MAIKTKSFEVGGKAYKIRQHPAIEGCELLESYGSAINAFCSISREQAFVAVNKEIIPFQVGLSAQFLGLLMFMDKVADTSPFIVPDQPQEGPKKPQLTVKQIKEGLTLADLESVQDEAVREPMKLAHAIDYQATPKQIAAVDVDSVFERFLQYVTLDGEQVEIDSLEYAELAELLSHVLVFNFLRIWDKPRFNIPDGWSSGAESTASVKRAQAAYSGSNVIYTILQSNLQLASYADLKNTLNTEDAFDMNEAALLSYFEQAEAHKEAERQAKQQRG